jgi:hypothetical protein
MALNSGRDFTERMMSEVNDYRWLRCLDILANEDVETIKTKNEQYKNSWKRRGGVGAFMMLARKWDRLEAFVERFNYDVFEAIKADQRPEGILDDIRDLRRYLAMVESEMRVVLDETFPQD